MHFEGQLAQAHCQHPFAVLGPQYNGTNTFVQYWQPGAQAVEVVDAASGESLGMLNAINGDGLFNAVIEGLSSASAYQLKVTTDEGQSLVTDPRPKRIMRCILSITSRKTYTARPAPSLLRWNVMASAPKRLGLRCLRLMHQRFPLSVTLTAGTAVATLCKRPTWVTGCWLCRA